jgi:ABC-type glycerol-3-phosphate transport system permease component
MAAGTIVLPVTIFAVLVSRHMVRGLTMVMNEGMDGSCRSA